MNTILSALSALTGLIFLAAGLFNVWILTQYLSKKNTASALGTLTNAKTRKNVRGKVGHRQIVFKHWTDFSYTYTVNGKEYHSSGFKPCPGGKLPKMPRIIYLTKFPWHGYVEELTNMAEPLRAFVCFLLCALCFMMV